MSSKKSCPPFDPHSFASTLIEKYHGRETPEQCLLCNFKMARVGGEKTFWLAVVIHYSTETRHAVWHFHSSTKPLPTNSRTDWEKHPTHNSQTLCDQMTKRFQETLEHLQNGQGPRTKIVVETEKICLIAISKLPRIDFGSKISKIRKDRLNKLA